MQGLPLPWRVEVSTLRTCDGAAKPSASDGIDARGECTLLLALTRGDVEAAEQLLSELLEAPVTRGFVEVFEVWGQLDTVVEKTKAGLTQCGGSTARLLQAYRSWCRG